MRGARSCRPTATGMAQHPFLLGLTMVTGLVDAFSYLVIGHVFVANVTGNVAFIGFASPVHRA